MSDDYQYDLLEYLEDFPFGAVRPSPNSYVSISIILIYIYLYIK